MLKERAYERGEINEIANMAFITGQTNRRISNKEPVLYLRDIVARQGSTALETQKVPLDETLWDVARYRNFLEHRRKSLTDCMNQLIKAKAGLA